MAVKMAHSSQLTAHSSQLTAAYCLLSTSSEIKDKLLQFIKYLPGLEERVRDINAYTEKLSRNANVLCQYVNDKCTGFCAYYANDLKTKTGYITLIAIHEEFRRQGFGRRLIRECFDRMKTAGMNHVRLEVRKDNDGAIAFYRSEGLAFESEASPESFYMAKILNQ